MATDSITLALLAQRLERIEHELFGNGQPGKIREIEDTLDVLRTYAGEVDSKQAKATLNLEAKIKDASSDLSGKLKEIKWLVILLVAVTAFVTGSGTISLKEVIALFH